MSFLAKIIDTKQAQVQQDKQVVPFKEIEAVARTTSPPRRTRAALEKAARTGYGLIAEIKKASPSKGVIRSDFVPADLAREYAFGGASCLSVLTDEVYFQGSKEDLQAVRAVSDLPILRKDFLLDPYQVAETRALGADCALLILAALEDSLAAELDAAISEWKMDTLVEVHSDKEMERALLMGSRLIGINNRDLDTFETNLATTERLAKMAPDDVLLVSESGITCAADLARLAAAGVRNFLVGETLMRSDDVSAATHALLAQPTTSEY